LGKWAIPAKQFDSFGSKGFSMRISDLFRPKSIILSTYFAGVMAFAGGCGEGGQSPAGAAADSKKIEDEQRAAREKAFGPSGNAPNGAAAKASPAPSESKAK
jgi:hypothetical protein